MSPKMAFARLLFFAVRLLRFFITLFFAVRFMYGLLPPFGRISTHLMEEPLFVVCFSCGLGRGFAVHLLWGSV